MGGALDKLFAAAAVCIAFLFIMGFYIIAKDLLGIAGAFMLSR